MPRTEIRSNQIKDETILIDDLADFAPEDAGGLNVTVAAGRIRNDNTITDKTSQNVSLTASSTNYVEIDASGVATANTSAFTSGRIAIAEVVTDGSSVTSITDKRTWIATSGSGGGVSGTGTANRIARFTDTSTIGDAQISQDGTTGVLTALKALAPTVVTLTDGASVSLDASLGNHFKLTAAGDRTINAPTNETSGQRIIIEHVASGADRTLTLTTGSAGAFRFGTDITALTLTASGTTDYIGCVYNSADDRWDVVAYVKGF